MARLYKFSRVFVLCLLCLFIYISPVQAEDKPYKATTVDECIHEEACVWFYFENVATDTNRPDGNRIVHRWEKDIHPYIVVDKRERSNYEKVEAEIINKIQDIVPVRVSFQKDAVNYFIFPSNDFDKDIYGKYKKFLIKMFSGHFHELYERTNINRIKPENAVQNLMSTPFYNNQNIDGYCIFIKPELLVGRNEIISSLFISLGFYVSSSLLPFTKIENGRFNNLHRLLVGILYNRNIKAGMTIEQVKPIFRTVYQDELNKISG